MESKVAPVDADSSDRAGGVPVQPTGAEPVTRSLPATLSPSRASDFMTCPLLYRFRMIDRLPERPSPAAVRGTVVHAALERLFDLPRGGRTLAEAVALLRPQWQRLLDAKPELGELFGGGADEPAVDESAVGAWLDEAAALVERYFTLEDPNRLDPVERELYVSVPIGGDETGDAAPDAAPNPASVLLHGYIDRVDVAPNGAVRIVDYKTGRAPGPLFEAKALFQMKFYALVLWKLRGTVPRRLQLMYLGSGDVLTYDPDEADLRATERKLTALWAAIRSAVAAGRWPASPSRLCDWCDHKPICPAHGGTPPPLPTVTVVPARPRDVAASESDPPLEPPAPPEG